MSRFQNALVVWGVLALPIILWFNYKYGGDGMLWPTYAQANCVLAVGGPVLGLFALLAALRRATQEDALSELRAARPDWRIPRSPHILLTAGWTICGLLPGVALARFWVTKHPDVPGAGFMIPIVAMIGLLAAGYSSPLARYHRKIEELLYVVRRLSEEARLEREAEERKEREAKWLARLKDASYWWVAHGSRLTSDLEYFEDYLRAHASTLLAKREQILAAYNDDRDPCASRAQTTEIAAWAVEHQQDLLADRLPDSAHRTVERLGQILHAHRKRDVTLLAELEPAMVSRTAKSVPPIRDEAIGDRWRRTVRVAGKILEFKEQATLEITEEANKIEDTDRRKAFVELHTQLMRDLAEEELRRRMEAAP